MKLEIISFTKAGSQLCAHLTEALNAQGEECRGYVPERFLSDPALYPAEPVGDWTGARFDQADGLIYIGAAGIAVRAVAPYLRDKLTDPAVVAVDEQGRYAVSLLSGHVGGANRLAEKVARILEAEPVITTASDRQGLTAVDVWAEEQGLVLSDRNLAKQVASALVNGERVGFFSDFPDRWRAPDGYEAGQRCRLNVHVTCRSDQKQEAGKEPAMFLRLLPRILTLGIGCRRGTEVSVIRRAAEQVFQEYGLDIRTVKQIASIDLKQDEPGLCRFAEELGTEFITFSAETLQAVEGSPAVSEFVQQVTGASNVCERAALCGAGERAVLLVEKKIREGVTVAVAVPGDGQEYVR